MNFTNDLHRDLFDLLLIEAFSLARVTVIRSRQDMKWIMGSQSMVVAKKLCGQENHPEEYLGYVFECGWNNYNMVLIDKNKSDKHVAKIKFYFEELK